MERKIILHIPHSSKHIDEKHLKQFTNKGELNDTIEKLTDIYTDNLFLDFTKEFVDDYVKFDYSRAYCDVERFSDDDKEPMSKKGMGVLYTKGINGKEFRTYTDEQKQEVLNIYNKHHDTLRDKISQFNKQDIKPLLIDCHSFANEKYANDGLLTETAESLPDFCLGFNGKETKLIKDIKIFLESQGFAVGLNNPYSGSLSYDDLEHGSIMIEVNKKLYLTKNNEKKVEFYKIAGTIAYIMRMCKNFDY